VGPARRRRVSIRFVPRIGHASPRFAERSGYRIAESRTAITSEHVLLRPTGTTPRSV
jgi:hypothetical protein